MSLANFIVTHHPMPGPAAWPRRLFAPLVIETLLWFQQIIQSQFVFLSFQILVSYLQPSNTSYQLRVFHPQFRRQTTIGCLAWSGLTMFLGIRDAKQGAKPWGAEGGLVVEATQLSCAKTDKANQIAMSRGQGLRVFCQTSGFDNEWSNTALFLTSSDRSEMPGAVSSYYGPGNGSRPNAF